MSAARGDAVRGTGSTLARPATGRSNEVAALKRAVAHDRQVLRAAIERAQRAAKRELDVGGRLADRRWAVLGASFCLGLWLGVRH
jgi:hypothetical protein